MVDTPTRRIGTLDGATDADDAAYLDFIEGIRVFTVNDLTPALHQRYAELEAAFEARHGRKPVSVEEIRSELDSLPILQTHRRLFRSTQDMRGVALIETYGKREAELIRELDEFATRGPGRLLLDPTLRLPEYYTKVYFHRQPGGYADHPLAGYIYHYGTKLLFGGQNDDDSLQRNMVKSVPLPAGRVERVVDLACAIGQSTTAWKERLPHAEVWGIDCSAPMLRYAHKRAVEMGLDITFAQMLAEDLKLPDNSVDIVHCFILFHEVPVEVGEQVLRQVYRVLRPGGLFSVMDVGQAPQWNPLDAYLREFIIRDNAEPYEAGWAYWDFPGALRAAGFQTGAGPDSEIENFPGSNSAHHSRWFAYKPA
jgi:SAM-dependent methyltransferase